MTGDWRDFRPAIWLALLGVALFALVNPPYIGVAVLGGAIGVAVRIERRRRRPPDRSRGSARSGGSAGTDGRARSRGRGRNPKR